MKKFNTSFTRLGLTQNISGKVKKTQQNQVYFLKANSFFLHFLIKTQ